MFRTIRSAVVAGALCCGGLLQPVSSAWAGPLFEGLGDLPGGAFSSSASAISADGSVVVGYSKSAFAPNGEAFRWTRDEGMIGLGAYEADGLTPYSQAVGVSGDGSVIVGRSDAPDFTTIAYRWSSSNGMVFMRDFNPQQHLQSIATAASADGSVIIGQARTMVVSVSHAFRWTASTGMVSLGNLPGGENLISGAQAVTPDGSVVAGFGRTALGVEASRWTAETGMVGLGDLPGGNYQSSAYGISADGMTIVGYASGPDGKLPFRWTESTGMEALDTGSAAVGGEALALSGDGSIIVGKTASLGAFIWDEIDGLRSLQSVLTDEFGLGAALEGWTLKSATGISADGSTIVGYGRNPAGQTEAFVVVIPEPTGLCLLGLLAPWALLCRRRAPRS